METCEKRSVTPARFASRDAVASANDAECEAVAGDGFCKSERAASKLILLEHAHRSVPEDRARLRDFFSVGSYRLHPNIQCCAVCRNGVHSDSLCLV